MNMKALACEEERKLQLQELEELRLEAFDSTMWYKERTKLWHERNLRVKELRVGKKVLLFQSQLKLMSGKLKSKWIGPYTIVGLRANEAVEIQGSAPNSVPFLVNGHRANDYSQRIPGSGKMGTKFYLCTDLGNLENTHLQV
ncbi:uncharacterized protein LOC125194827 [Salvia hispanica]|uniref:uncharacterized protein LOC125194827 n=1 Tax=Salvia hispanica TaxID=49212 RepID=UPI002009B602|nr:uncharacterized protein LOC125194827 [Salvia hispanica]